MTPGKQDAVFISRTVVATGWTMLHYLWAGGVLGLLAAVLQRLIGSANASVRYLVALASLSVVAAAPVAIVFWVIQDLPQDLHSDQKAVTAAPPTNSLVPPQETTTSAPAQPSTSPDHFSFETVETVETDEASETSETSESLAEHVLHTLAAYLPWLWLMGAPLTLVVLATGLVGAERLRRQSRLLVDGALVASCRQLARSMGVAVDVCDRIATPILVGILRPIILLPPAVLTGWSAQQIEMVLLHELAHVRRWDNLVNLIQRIIESVLFFQPAVWLLSSDVRREREHCCDDVAVACTGEPQAYAETLAALAGSRLTFDSFNKSAAAMATKPGPVVSSMDRQPLIARIRYILKHKEEPMKVSRKVLGLLLSGLLTLVSLIGWWGLGVGLADGQKVAEEAPVVVKERPDGDEFDKEVAFAKEIADTISPRLQVQQSDEKQESQKTQVARESLRYDGKSFREWRTYLTTELNQELRFEGLKAMGIFGVNGYAEEAASVILEVVKGHDLSWSGNQENRSSDSAGVDPCIEGS